MFSEVSVAQPLQLMYSCPGMSLVTYFSPSPRVEDLPTRFPSPFAVKPHELAHRAALAVQAELRSQPDWQGGHEFAAADGGKMFGVLVVVDGAGRVGYLRGVSGTLAGRWEVPGFVPPLFDWRERNRFWPSGQKDIEAIEQRISELAVEPDAIMLRARLESCLDEQQSEATTLQDLHRKNRAQRHEERELGDCSDQALHRLAQQSRADRAEKRRLRDAHAQARLPLEEAVKGFDEQLAALKQQRNDRSNALLQRMQAAYHLCNRQGERQPLGRFFDNGEPPGGTGDCAGPKLLGYANREALRPIALAEFWWGSPPISGGRHSGGFYPSCRGKCAPILPHQLEGMDVEPAPIYGADTVEPQEPRCVYEDEHLVIVEKPCGLLSVPGRSPLLKDSVLLRLQKRYPEATGPLLVHRLDLDTSGLLLAGKSADVHADLQRLFARRDLEKRYIAWLEGNVACDRGRIELALRVDPNDRPRQVYDPLHGREAITDYVVLARTPEHTKVAFYPRTGRTHQLRVHASHPLGLGAPIVGDRLYGRTAGRLMLHAQSLSFVHPRTNERLEISSETRLPSCAPHPDSASS